MFFNREEVKNQFEEPVTDSQIHGRSLLKAFTAAASFAKQNYGVSWSYLLVISQNVSSSSQLRTNIHIQCAFEVIILLPNHKRA